MVDFNALRSIRSQIEETIEIKRREAGIDDTPEVRRFVLEHTIDGLQKDFDQSLSVTERLWLGRFISEAKAMLEDV